MRIRPGRKRSLFAGIMMLVVTLVGLAMMSRFSGPSGGVFGPFVIAWVAIGLVGAAMAFYNAFSEEGLPIYEIDTGIEADEEEDNGDERDVQLGLYCPQCGQPVHRDDQFCRHCGTRLVE